jgi:hypothetical protein
LKQGGASQKKSLFLLKIEKFWILEKKIKKQQILDRSPQNQFLTIFYHQGDLFRPEVSNKIQKLYFRKFHYHIY